MNRSKETGRKVLEQMNFGEKGRKKSIWNFREKRRKKTILNFGEKGRKKSTWNFDVATKEFGINLTFSLCDGGEDGIGSIQLRLKNKIITKIFNFDLIRDTIVLSKNIVTHRINKCAIHRII